MEVGVIAFSGVVLFDLVALGEQGPVKMLVIVQMEGFGGSGCEGKRQTRRGGLVVVVVLFTHAGGRRGEAGHIFFGAGRHPTFPQIEGWRNVV